MNTLTICRENHDNRLLPFLFEIVGQQSEKVIFKNVGNTKKQFCVNIFLFEYEVHICPATVQLIRQPSRTPPLLHKHLFYCVTNMYIESFFHKKGVNCLLIYCCGIGKYLDSIISSKQSTPSVNYRLLIPIEFLILPIFNSREQERKAQKVIMLQNITSYHLFLFCKNRNKM